MSGICGIFNRDGTPIDPDQLHQMTQLLEFRGRDGTQTWSQNNIGFGHTLFRTTWEAAAEQQPCTLDGRTYITADARIDAREDLIPRLQAKGCQVIRQAPAPEVLLHAYTVWGEDFLADILGDFAFALWDSDRQTLLCGRDHFGTRVLYYAQVGNTFVFSNVLTGVQKFPGVTKILNDQAIGDWLLFEKITWLDKEQTLWQDIQKVPPAHILKVTLRDRAINRYWHFPLHQTELHYKNPEDYLAHFRSVMTTAIADRLRTDRGVVSMSGGMDSTTVAALALELIRQNDLPIDLCAYTVALDRVHPNQERYYAELVAQTLNLPIHVQAIDDYQAIAGRRISEAESPSDPIDPGALGQLMLTGNAGDNLLWLSPPKTMAQVLQMRGLVQGSWHLWQLYQQQGIRLPAGTTVLAKLGLNEKPIAPEVYPPWLNPEFEQRINLPERWHRVIHWMPDPVHPRHPLVHQWMVFPDWTANAEVGRLDRCPPPEKADPYLDLRLLNFVLALPNLPWLHHKYIQRQAMRDYLPRAVIERPKTLAGLVVDSLLKQPQTSWVDEWTPHPLLHHYINVPEIPKIADLKGVHKSWHLRPLRLNRLITQLSG
jgi:asparagine synthase (glutamine-hydrolysing)